MFRYWEELPKLSRNDNNIGQLMQRGSTDSGAKSSITPPLCLLLALCIDTLAYSMGQTGLPIGEQWEPLLVRSVHGSLALKAG